MWICSETGSIESDWVRMWRTSAIKLAFTNLILVLVLLLLICLLVGYFCCGFWCCCCCFRHRKRGGRQQEFLPSNSPVTSVATDHPSDAWKNLKVYTIDVPPLSPEDQQTIPKVVDQDSARKMWPKNKRSMIAPYASTNVTKVDDNDSNIGMTRI